MSVRTVKITNLSLSASEQDVKEFFSFSGEIEHVEMHSADTYSQIAYVTFKDAQGADTALLLSGATIVDMSVVISPAPEYTPPPSYTGPEQPGGAASSAPGGGPVHKAEDVVSSMLARGFTLGKDTVFKAKSFDQKHGLTSTASLKVKEVDQKIGLSQKFAVGSSAVNEKVREVDQKFQVSEKTKSALSAAEQKVSETGSALMRNRYIFSGVSWATSAFNKVADVAGEVGNKTKEKMAAQEGSSNNNNKSGGGIQ